MRHFPNFLEWHLEAKEPSGLASAVGSDVYFPNAPLLPVYAYSRPIKITWKVRRSPFWEASHLPVLGMTIYFGIQELRDVLKFREFLGKAARSCQKCKFQISNVRTPFRNDRTNLRCLHSQDNVSQSSKSLSNISTYLAFCIVPSMLLACWHKCPLVKILSKIYQDVQRNVFTKTISWCRPSDHCFQIFALWSTGDWSIICSDIEMDQIWQEYFLLEGSLTHPMCVKVDRAWRPKCSSSLGPEARHVLVQLAEKDHQPVIHFTGKQSPDCRNSLFGKVGIVLEIKWEAGCRVKTNGNPSSSGNESANTIREFSRGWACKQIAVRKPDDARLQFVTTCNSTKTVSPDH